MLTNIRISRGARIASSKTHSKMGIVASYKDLFETYTLLGGPARCWRAAMRLRIKQSQALTAVTVRHYRQGSKKVKQHILNEFARALVTAVVVSALSLDVPSLLK